MLLRSFWMAAWLIVSLNMQTLGPKAGTFASGQAGEDAAAARLAAAGPAGAATAALAPAGARTNPEPASITAVAASKNRRLSQRLAGRRGRRPRAGPGQDHGGGRYASRVPPRLSG
jgi:hypothetical protein